MVVTDPTTPVLFEIIIFYHGFHGSVIASLDLHSDHVFAKFSEPRLYFDRCSSFYPI